MDQIKARMQFEQARSTEYPPLGAEISVVFSGSLADSMVRRGLLFGQETDSGTNLWKVQAASAQFDASLESSDRRLNFKIQLRCCFCKCELRGNLPLFLCARGTSPVLRRALLRLRLGQALA